jgi:hypothetical protein
MAVSPTDIVPVDSASAAPAPAEAPAPVEGDSDGDGLPDEVLQLPFMAALLQGKPAATYVDNDAPPPEAEIILKYADPLADAGFRIYASKSKPVTVFYNAAVLPPEEVQAADNEGKLDQVAVPFSELQELFAGIKREGGGEASPEAAPAAGAAPAQPMGGPPVNQQTTNARVRNLAPGAPTSGPTPGQGRIMANITKPVI